MAPETLAPAGTQSPAAAAAAAASPERKSRRLSDHRNALSSPLYIVPPTTPMKSPSSLSIEQGPGAKLKDIPNVFFKVSKRKADESLQLLHRILFKRRANVHHLKRNIFQFSGFVWADNEKILKERLKEKLDKCTKDKLLELSELLDLQIRSSAKKEELVEKLLEFLQSPQSTRDTILAEKEKKGKRKRKTKAVSRTVKGGASSERKQKRKASPGTEVKKSKKRSRSDEVKKGNEIQGSLSEKEDEDEQSSAVEENSDDPDFSYKAKQPLSQDQVKRMEEDETDKLDTSTVTMKSSEGQDATEVKINGDDLPTNEEDPSKPVLVEASLKDDDDDMEDVPPPRKNGSSVLVEASLKDDDDDMEDVPPPRKKGSSKGQTSKLSKPSTEEKSAASKKASAKIAKTKSNSSPTKEKAAASKKASAKTAKTKSNSSPTENSVDVTACDPPLPSKSKKVNKKKDTGSENSAPGDNKPVKKPTAKNTTHDSVKEAPGDDKLVKKTAAKNTTQDSIEEAPGDDKLVKKTAAKNTTQDSIKENGKEKASGKSNVGPSKEELHSVISSVLKEVDVNTATLADLIGKLGAHFKMDLMDRKKEVKLIIEEVMNNTTDEEDDSENEED